MPAEGPGAPAARGRWSPTTLPEQLGLLGLGLALAAPLYRPVSEATGLIVPCPLRTITGVPCPLCGMTTAATALAGGDLGAAMAANPFWLLIAAGTAVMVVLMAGRLLGAWRAGPRFGQRGQRLTALAVTVLAAASWTWQLHRTGWL